MRPGHERRGFSLPRYNPRVDLQTFSSWWTALGVGLLVFAFWLYRDERGRR